MGNERSSPTVEQEQELFQSSIGSGPAGANKRLLARLLAVIEGFWMQSIGETEILIEATIVGKVRVQKISALAALHPRIGLVVGVDLNPIDGSLHSGKARPDEYWLTELRGNLYLSENGPSIGSVHWIGAHCEIRSQPYPSESQLQLACDLDPGTLERLETARGGNDLALWIELWPRIEHPGGYLSASIRGFRLAVARVEWLRFLEGVGYGTYELMELRIPKENAELTHRSIDGIREAQHRLWLGDHGGALAEARKVIEALESLAPEKKLEPLLSGYHATRAKAYAGIASRLKEIASAAVHDYGRGEVFSREEVSFVIGTVASLTSVVLDVAHGTPGLGTKYDGSD